VEEWLTAVKGISERVSRSDEPNGEPGTQGPEGEAPNNIKKNAH